MCQSYVQALKLRSQVGGQGEADRGLIFFYPTLGRGASLKPTGQSLSCIGLIASQSVLAGEVSTDEEK